MTNFYSKLTQCNHCKELCLDACMVTDPLLGKVCANCAKIIEGYNKYNDEQKKLEVIEEIKTY